jgi:hypothetical protein
LPWEGIIPGPPLLMLLLARPPPPPPPDALQPARMPNSHKILFFQMTFQAFESTSPIFILFLL